jgi:hypothetical protein
VVVRSKKVRKQPPTSLYSDSKNIYKNGRKDKKRQNKKDPL